MHALSGESKLADPYDDRCWATGAAPSAAPSGSAGRLGGTRRRLAPGDVMAFATTLGLVATGLASTGWLRLVASLLAASAGVATLSGAVVSTTWADPGSAVPRS
jgi:hypothetical protein